MRGNLLIIADDEQVRRFLVTQLKMEGYSVSGAGTAEEAMERLRTESFQVIIVDLLLPNVEGFGFVRELKSRHPGVPVLILTGMGYKEDLLKGALDAGADDYASKSDHIGNLIADVHRLQAQRPAPR